MDNNYFESKENKVLLDSQYLKSISNDNTNTFDNSAKSETQNKILLQETVSSTFCQSSIEK